MLKKDKLSKALKEVDAKVMTRLNLKTLDTRGSDSLDFHDISAASIRDVIKIAFKAGAKFGSEEKGIQFLLNKMQA